ncbi:MAG: hypothetical protein ACREL6_11120 [Gemmatimonadales bacterium]
MKSELEPEERREPGNEWIEVTCGTIAGALGAGGIHLLFGDALPPPVTPLRLILGGAIVGFLGGMAWSARRVARVEDPRIPLHLRPRVRMKDGRPLGVIAHRSRHFLLDYLMWVLAVLVGIGIVVVVRRYL